MEYIKTYEGFFDLFKSDSEDDKIALIFINRLRKIKGISPYKIEKDLEVFNDAGTLTKYIITFDDMLLIVKQGYFKHRRPQGKKFMYNVTVECTGEYEKVKCREKYEKELFRLLEIKYELDKESRRIDRIKSEINPSADLIN